MIEVKNLSKKFKAPSEEKGIFGFKKKDFWAVKDLNFNIKEGSVASILGPNGCGKTTTLRMIAGFVMPTAGEIFIGNNDITFQAPEKRNIGFVFQNYAIFPHMNVFENISFGLKMRNICLLYTSPSPRDGLLSRMPSSA